MFLIKSMTKLYRKNDFYANTFYDINHIRLNYKAFFLFYIKIDHLNFKLVRNRFFVNIFFLSFLVNINTIFLSKNTDFLFRKIMDE